MLEGDAKTTRQALEAARSIANYCLSRFPCDTPPNEMLDVPWFAEKVQAAIDAARLAEAPAAGRVPIGDTFQLIDSAEQPAAAQGAGPLVLRSARDCCCAPACSGSDPNCKTCHPVTHHLTEHPAVAALRVLVTVVKDYLRGALSCIRQFLSYIYISMESGISGTVGQAASPPPSPGYPILRLIGRIEVRRFPSGSVQIQGGSRGDGIIIQRADLIDLVAYLVETHRLTMAREAQ